MSKPRIIIADTDEKYILPLQLKFVEEYFNKIELEIITEKSYFESLFSSPQKIDVLIISEEFYNSNLQRHNINNIFVMVEQSEGDWAADPDVVRLFKYTSIKEIFSEIVGKSAGSLQVNLEIKKECQIILVCSACGGAGKTTVALGMSMYLSKSYKKVLYINAERLQSFQRMLENKSVITASDVYTKLSAAGGQIYEEIKHVIRKEVFSYLPAFKASLLSLGLPYSIYETFALSVKKTGDYDYIVIDAETAFDEDKARLIDLADKVVIVTKQNTASVYTTNVLAVNINGIDSEKYIFICNDFDKDKENALISPAMTKKFIINNYVGHFKNYDQLTCEDLSKDSGIQKASILVM